MPQIVFEGYNAEHTVRNVTVDGVYINGERITDRSIVQTNEFTSEIHFK